MFRINKSTIKLFFVMILACAGLQACMVGPTYHAPEAPHVQRYTDRHISNKTASVAGPGGQSQHFNYGKSIPAQWWTLFNSPALNQLIERGLANSPTVKAAQAALLGSQEILSAEVRSRLIPSVSGNAGAARERRTFSSLGIPIPTLVIPGVPTSESQNFIRTANVFSLYNATVGVSYMPDFFGANRRAIEATASRVEFQQYELEAAYLTLTSNIVTTAVATASLAAQIQATRELINLQKNQVNIVKKEFELGYASGSDVFLQETQLAQTQSSLPVLRKNWLQSRNALAALVGALPSEGHLPTIKLDELKLPQELPVSLPSVLVKQRPDIQAAQASLHYASAEIGVATANLFPQITLTANYGYFATALADMFDPANSIWTLGGQLLQPIFNGGALRAKQRVAKAAYEESLFKYRETVIHAFQNVADSLQAIQVDADLLVAVTHAEKSAYQTLRVAQRQYQLGGGSYLAVLIAQQEYHRTRITRIQIQALRYADTAALFQALGGGWWDHAGRAQCH